MQCPDCRQSVMSAVSLSHRRYLLDPDPVAAAAGGVIFVSPSGDGEEAHAVDRAEHFRLHRCYEA